MHYLSIWIDETRGKDRSICAQNIESIVTKTSWCSVFFLFYNSFSFHCMSCKWTYEGNFLVDHNKQQYTPVGEEKCENRITYVYGPGLRGKVLWIIANWISIVLVGIVMHFTQKVCTSIITSIYENQFDAWCIDSAGLKPHRSWDVSAHNERSLEPATVYSHD